jgi:hypothetical protein
MKRIVGVVGLASLLSAAAAASLGAQTPASGRARVAVLDFGYATVHSTVNAIFGRDGCGQGALTCS